MVKFNNKMPRELSEITKRDLEILKLGKQVLKVVKNRREWRLFIKYMEVYFEEKLKVVKRKKSNGQ